jgi:hypothetical protein
MLKEAVTTYFLVAVPLLSFAVLTITVYTSLRWLKYRHTFCQLETIPGEIGGEFKAVLFPKPGLEKFNELLVRLTCVQNITEVRRRKHYTRDMVLWTNQYVSTIEQLTERPGEPITIPVHFQIPDTCRESTPDREKGAIEWELSISTASPGINFHVSFIVPVFSMPVISAAEAESNVP